jgi:hypothetical protein
MASVLLLGLFLHLPRVFASLTSARLCRTWFILSIYTGRLDSLTLPFLAIINDLCLRLQDQILMARSKNLQMEVPAAIGSAESHCIIHILLFDKSNLGNLHRTHG